MNNKRLGTEFEREVCDKLSEAGWWVHFLSPNNAGAQPFDIIAVKKGVALAMDCKTSCTNVFASNRLEDNQIYAFEKWLECGNAMPLIVIKYNDNCYFVPFEYLRDNKKVDLNLWINADVIF